MPEPNTLSGTPDGPNPPPGSTAGWVQAPSAEPPADATQTQPPRPTPGPEDPGRLTDSEATERMEDTPGDAPGALPRIAGLRIEKLIGRGGMGRVYRAVHLELNRVVALKLITTAGRDEESVRGRFEREVRALARIEHPNIVPIYHAGDWHGFPYFTMKFVPGGALSQHLARFTGRPEACAKLVAKVARAVQALHDAGVVHRDLKPLNILLGDNDEPLVADFGLAKWLDDPASDLTLTHVPLGTRQYMAPEQTLGVRCGYSRACDVWALGVTLYELLAGVRPFPDDGSSDLYERIRTADPPPLPPSVPAGLASIIGRCLAKKPEDRYPTAAAVADDLDRWVAGEVIPPTRRPGTPTWVRALGVFLLVAIIVLPAALIPWSRSDPDRRPVEGPRSVAEQLRAGLTVRLTDPKGKPLVPVVPPPDMTIPSFEDRNGDFTFTSQGMAVGELVNEALPLPVRLDAEVEVFAGRSTLPFAGVYAGGRPWNTGIPSRSLVRFVAGPRYGPGGTTFWCRAEGFWWPQEKGGIVFPLGHADIPMKTPPADTWKATVCVELYPDVLVPAMHGQQLPRITGERLLTGIREHIASRRDRDALGPFVIQPPAFGTGIGISVGSADAVIRNLTLSPLQR